MILAEALWEQSYWDQQISYNVTMITIPNSTVQKESIVHVTLLPWRVTNPTLILSLQQSNLM